MPGATHRQTFPSGWRLADTERIPHTLRLNRTVNFNGLGREEFYPPVVPFGCASACRVQPVNRNRCSWRGKRHIDGIGRFCLRDSCIGRESVRLRQRAPCGSRSIET
jgi:hypothetical protein